MSRIAFLPNWNQLSDQFDWTKHICCIHGLYAFISMFFSWANPTKCGIVYYRKYARITCIFYGTPSQQKVSNKTKSKINTVNVYSETAAGIKLLKLILTKFRYISNVSVLISKCLFLLFKNFTCYVYFVDIKILIINPVACTVLSAFDFQNKYITKMVVARSCSHILSSEKGGEGIHRRAYV